MIVIHSIATLVLAYLLFNTLYNWFFAVAGRILPRIKTPHNPTRNSFVIYVPCYKGDAVILHTVAENLKVDYPSHKFKMVVIADHLQEETIAKLREQPIQVVTVNFDNSTKAKSLIAAAQQTSEDWDYAVILDIDNIMKRDYLQKLNAHLLHKPLILQGHRVALNTDTSMATLDAISEEIGNFIFRLGHAKVGLSAAFIGSAKAIEFEYYKDFIPQIEAIGGFDKEMEIKLLSGRKRIHYAPDAYVYDEKVQQIKNFQNQRKRWLSAQLHYLKTYLVSGIVQLLTKGNIDYFDKVLQMALFPRLLLLGVSTLLAVLAIFLPLFPGSPWWWFNALMLYLAFFMALPRWAYSFNTLKAILSLPRTFVVMFLTLFQLKGANKKFIHTEHSATTKRKTDEHHENRH